MNRCELKNENGRDHGIRQGVAIAFVFLQQIPVYGFRCNGSNSGSVSVWRCYNLERGHSERSEESIMIIQVGYMDSSVAEFTLSTANVLPLNDNLQTATLPNYDMCNIFYL